MREAEAEELPAGGHRKLNHGATAGADIGPGTGNAGLNLAAPTGHGGLDLRGRNGGLRGGRVGSALGLPGAGARSGPVRCCGLGLRLRLRDGRRWLGRKALGPGAGTGRGVGGKRGGAFEMRTDVRLGLDRGQARCREIGRRCAGLGELWGGGLGQVVGEAGQGKRRGQSDAVAWRRRSRDGGSGNVGLVVRNWRWRGG